MPQVNNELKFNVQANQEFELLITIDSVPVNYNIVDNNIVVTSDIPLGFHMLNFKLINPSDDINVRINSGSLDDVDLRHTIYMMFALDSNKNRFQTTILTHRDNELYLPFANPISWWLSSCAEKIPSRLFSSRLYDELAVYYPESINISDKFPKLMRDFFSTNIDFHTHPKHLLDNPYCNSQVPYATLDKKIDFDEAALFNELMSQLDYLKETSRIPAQQSYNKTTSPGRWLANHLIISHPDEYSLETKFSIDKTRVPLLYSLIDQLNLDVIVHSFLGILGPGEYAAPHIDDYETHKWIVDQYGGCSQLYIPINFKKGNLFKFNKIGLLPVDKPLLINNHNYSHALINDSDEYRFGLAIVGSQLK
jgi:hypothetical protein